MMLGYDHAVMAGAGAVLGAAGREMFNWVAEKVFRRKNGNGNGNGNGLSNAARRDVQEIFETTLKIDVIPILNGQTLILQSITETNKSMSNNIVRLTAIEETRGRRR